MKWRIKMRDLWSHPNVKLENHLGNTANWGKFYTSEMTCKFMDNVDDDLLKSFFIFHDVGKSTGFFQKYIRNEEVDNSLKSHASISALLFLYYHILSKKIHRNEEIIVSMSYAILKHHGNLKEFSEIDNIINKSILENPDKEMLIMQYNSIDVRLKDKLIQLGLNKIVLDEVFSGNSYKFVEELIKFFTVRRRGKLPSLKGLKKLKEDNEQHDLYNYFMIQFFYSLLIDSDKSQVVLGDTKSAKRFHFNVDVKEYIYRLDSKLTDLNKMRTEALLEVEGNLYKHNSNIYTLTLPTGMGKTLNSFNFALKLREKLLKETGKEYRIIYVMPFMSIIDQNAKIFENVFKEELKAAGKLNHGILCKHHHLTEIEWITNENTLLDKESAQLLIEGWNSEVIVTTFWQFFTTLAGSKNSTQRKFNKLCNCIVIIDEIQALPVKYYKFIKHMLIEYTKLMDSKIIAMTATQPHIFDVNQSMELCDYVKYYKNLNRTKVINELSYCKNVEEFVIDLECDESKTYLFILNTIQSCRELYILLKERFPGRKITYLSTMLPPVERFDRINKIKKKEFDIVVSTQLVEAGVDIDFNVVYRDFSPLPMIFQSAGRGNREGSGQEQAQIHIIKLRDRKGSLYADKVYKNSKTELDITERLLNDYEYLNESEFMDVIENYFKIISDESIKSQHISTALLKGAKSGLFYKEKYNLSDEILPMNAFELIDNSMETFQVFIELDEKAKGLWEKYTELSEIKYDDEEKWIHKAEFKDIRRSMSDYVVNINISVKSKFNKPPMDNDKFYYYVCNSDIDNYYDLDMGYGVDTDAFYF
jgi:CRISPR-associated endonuclease/helicase Cas3